MTEPGNVKKTSGLNTDNQSSEEMMVDSDALFDLDMPLDDLLSDALDSEADDPADSGVSLPRMSTNNPETSTTNAAEELETLFSSFEEPGKSVREDDRIVDPADKITAPDNMDHASDIEHELSFLSERDMSGSQPENVSPAPPYTPERAANIPPEAKRQASKSADSAPSPAGGSKQSAEPASNTNGASNMKLANSMIYILGAALALIAGGGAWLASSAVDRVNALKRSTIPIVQENRRSGQAREQQLNRLEAEQSRQKKADAQRIDALEQQVRSLSMVLSNNASKQWQQTLDQPASTAAEHTTNDKSQAAATADFDKRKRAGKASVVTPVATSDAPVKAVKAIPMPTNTTDKAKMPPITPNDAGAWAINLTSVDSKKAAEREIANYKKQGIKAGYARIHAKGKIWYRVRVTGFVSEHDAIAYEKYLKDFKGIHVWRQRL